MIPSQASSNDDPRVSGQRVRPMGRIPLRREEEEEEEPALAAERLAKPPNSSFRSQRTISPASYVSRMPVQRLVRVFETDVPAPRCFAHWYSHYFQLANTSKPFSGRSQFPSSFRSFRSIRPRLRCSASILALFRERRRADVVLRAASSTEQQSECLPCGEQRPRYSMPARLFVPPFTRRFSYLLNFFFQTLQIGKSRGMFLSS